MSAIYGIGDPSEYHGMILHLRQGEKMSQRDVIARLIDTIIKERGRIDIDGALWIDTVAKALRDFDFKFVGVERARGAKHAGIYGLGEWREELDAQGDATLISSPSWAGAYPWIDKTTGVYGVMLAHIDVTRPNPERFSGFYSSPELAQLVRESASFSLRGSNVRGEWQIPDDLWPADIDSGQISQVMQNLAINAGFLVGHSTLRRSVMGE